MRKIETIFTTSHDNGAEGELGIDENAKLYWNGKPIVTEQKVKLEWWVNIAAIVASGSTLAMAIFSALQFLGIGCVK